MSAGSNDFWCYSLRAYQQPQVQALCLKLQDEWGLDVNIFLYCGWTANTGIALSAQGLHEAIFLAKQWSELTVHPLREMRRQMKQSSRNPVSKTVSEPIRESVKALELECEQALQHTLQTALENSDLLTNAHADTAELIRLNTQLYFRLAGLASSNGIIDSENPNNDTSAGIRGDKGMQRALLTALPLLKDHC